VRPEDLRPADPQSTSKSEALPRLQAQLEVVEPVGNEMFFYLRFAGNELVVRTPPGTPPRCGEQITLAFDPKRLHFFDAETERRII
jgi:multiple sugar transport system ATP-binding protein